MSENGVYRRADVLWRQTYDRVLILVPSSSEVLSLTATGCALWAALAKPGSLAQLAERLAATYGAPVEQISSDIAPVLQELAGYGAVAVSTGL